MKKLIYVFLFLYIGVLSFSIDEKIEMKNLILKIREESPKDFILMPQNGIEIYFDENKNIDLELIQAVDGITQESLKYGYPKYGKKTPKEEWEPLLEKLLILKKYEKPIFTVNYTKSVWGKWKSKKMAKEYSFINYCPNNIEATGINKKVININNKDITKLSQVKNFLYLLNPEKFRHKAEYLDTLAKTEYDLLIIDRSFKNNYLTKEDIEKLKYKPQGGKRLVIAYLSIGEAGDYRDYWKKEWSINLPEWILYENSNWEGDYIVKYWDPKWHKIIEKNLQEIIDSNFDGVFLDTIDTYLSLEEANDNE